MLVALIKQLLLVHCEAAEATSFPCAATQKLFRVLCLFSSSKGDYVYVRLITHSI